MSPSHNLPTSPFRDDKSSSTATDGMGGSDQVMNSPDLARSASHAQDYGPQVRSMGLKVHYTFDSEAKTNYLARYSHPLYVQTISLDETKTIGSVDLRACLQAVVECNPELSAQDGDYIIYTVDFSEPDMPFVGQGMLSWALRSMQPDSASQPPKLVIGRVTRNMLAVFGGGGNKETLEVKLKFTESIRTRWPLHHGSVEFQQIRSIDRPMDQQHSDRPVQSAIRPAGTSEWNSLLQSNPELGHATRGSHVVTNAPSRGPAPSADMTDLSHQPAAPQGLSIVAQDIQRVAPTPVDAGGQLGAPGLPSRPSSQASNRAPKKKAPKAPTGRPRGRPRKKPADSNTSGYEEATEGEEWHTKKRAKTVSAEKTTVSAFAARPESLRVAASTSSSIRSIRPVTGSNEATSAGHLQEVPRIPTPIPGTGPLTGLSARGSNHGKLQQESTPGQYQSVPVYSDSRLQPLSPGQDDGRSPESTAPTPTYSDDSLASSPPVHRATPFLRSSPPPSSPVLPPMPSIGLRPVEPDFANEEMDDLFGEEPMQAGLQNKMPVHANAFKSASRTGTSVLSMRDLQKKQGPTGGNSTDIYSCNDDAPCPEAMSSAGQPPSDAKPFSLTSSRSDVPCQGNASVPKAPQPVSIPSPAIHPTPPPTTDIVERPTSPMPTMDLTQNNADTSPIPATEPMQGVVVEADDRSSIHQTSPLETVESNEATVQQAQQQDQSSLAKPAKKKSAQTSRSRPARTLVRSQSAGAAALALPSIAASELVGPSSLSRSLVARSGHSAPPASGNLKRAVSPGPLAFPVPASDPVGPTQPPEAAAPPSDVAPPVSSPPPARSNKNRVKKHAIKQRLEEAIMNGEMPPFCSNCGAIETPTWRKIWVQYREGSPEYCEYSEKPGRVTAIEITKRDADDKPMSYRLVKKSLGSADDKSAWQELLLCNPCGIWLTKCKCHRPADRWDKDLSRIGQERRRKATGATQPRSRKPRPKNDGVANLTSEAYLLTDAPGSVDPFSPKGAVGEPSHEDSTRLPAQQDHMMQVDAPRADGDSRNGDDGAGSRPGSAHSRGCGTINSPAELEFDEAVGRTKRLLFPSPRKDGGSKVLGEIGVNIVQVFDEAQQLKRLARDKENNATDDEGGTGAESDQLLALLKSPTVARPSTPPANTRAHTAASGPLSTSPGPKSAHRPITRSVSRSLRSARSITSTCQILLQRTPSKTPRTLLGVLSTAGRRRSPRMHQGVFEHVDTPISRSISQLFSDPSNFDLVDDLDIGSLPTLEPNQGAFIDFGTMLNNEEIAATSSPRDHSAGFDYRGSVDLLTEWTMEHPEGLELDKH